MIRALQIEGESVALFLLALAFGGVFAFYSGHKNPQQYRISLPVIASLPTPTPSPSLVPLPKSETVTQSSPDGKKLLTMTVTPQSNSTKMYTFTTSDTDGTSKQQVYQAIFAKESMEIPFNTWSPDDNLIFIAYTSPTGKNVLVLRADGHPFSTGENAINATHVFQQKEPNILSEEITGWASETLLIVNSTNQDGSKGTSYWIEIPSKAVIPLSTQF